MTHGELQTKGQKEGADSEGRRWDLKGRFDDRRRPRWLRASWWPSQIGPAFASVT
jgi:hypothetical protein